MEEIAGKPGLVNMSKFLEIGDPFEENEFQLVKKDMPIGKSQDTFGKLQDGKLVVAD